MSTHTAESWKLWVFVCDYRTIWTGGVAEQAFKKNLHSVERSNAALRWQYKVCYVYLIDTWLGFMAKRCIQIGYTLCSAVYAITICGSMDVVYDSRIFLPFEEGNF